MKNFLMLNKTYFIATIILSSSLTPLAHSQMIPGYKGPSNSSSSQVPLHAKDAPPPATVPTVQTPSLPDREGGYVKNPMPSSVAPKMITPPPSNKVMEVDGKHIISQINDIVNESDERINKISLGNEKFPDHKTSMTELERDLDFDHRLREMGYLQKLSENGMKLFNTTYNGKREWAYEQGNAANIVSPVVSSSNNSVSSSRNVKEKPSFDSDADRLQLEHERALLEKAKLEDEQKKMEKAKADAEHKAEKHKKDLEIAKQKMKEATPDPKVTMIYGNGVIKADILVPYYGRLVGLKKGDVITGEKPMTITSIGDNTVTAKDEKGNIHILLQGDSVPKVKPSLSNFMPEDEE